MLILVVVVLVLSGTGEYTWNSGVMTKRLSYLLGDPSLNDYYQIDENSISMFASAKDKKENRPEAVISREEAGLFLELARCADAEHALRLYRQKGKNPYPPGTAAMIRLLCPVRAPDVYPPEKKTRTEPCRVALDPGHAARNIEEAVREKKFIQHTVKGKVLQFYESKLNLDTAMIVKTSLEKEGILVMLSRDMPGPATGLNVEDWIVSGMAKDVKALLDQGDISAETARFILERATADERFEFFEREIERPYRCSRINAFRPDLTVSIHYNANHEPEWHARNKDSALRRIAQTPGLSSDERKKMTDTVSRETHTTADNYSLVFVPGSFLAGELDTPRQRFHFLRLLLSGSVEESASVGEKLFRAMVRKLGTGPIPVRYAEDNNSITMRHGVYARNLRVTMLVNGRVLLAEPLLQNHPDESAVLHRDDMNIEGRNTNERVKKVAEVYVEVIRDFCRTRSSR